MDDADLSSLVSIVQDFSGSGVVRLCWACDKAYVTVDIDAVDDWQQIVEHLREMHRERISNWKAHAEYGCRANGVTMWEGLLRGWPSRCR